MTDNYDSASEQRIAEQMQSLGFIRYDGFYLVTFADKDGKSFRAKPDWYHPGLDLYAESKFHALNTKTTQATAAKALERQQQYRQMKASGLLLIDYLKNQWAHSKYKQAIVQRAMTPQQMIVVFEKPIPCDEMQAYIKAGLVCVPLGSLKSYTQYIHFVRKGLRCRYDLAYPEQGISFVL